MRAPKDPRMMSAREINKELDKLDARSSANTSALIAAGRGHERLSEIRSKDDPLSLECDWICRRQNALHAEIAARYGERAPYRLPLERGHFGPRLVASEEAEA